ncbi:hypothetical protein [Luteimonas chenhongjianii]|uniref:hypothetical protein n=1 Tax=Luteimonas chenhongjianii TaxID=2006110 RepID=UPI0012FE218F|nr:hypothetical protein [Luteimonas chenhongjianii]
MPTALIARLKAADQPSCEQDRHLPKGTEQATDPAKLKRVVSLIDDETWIWISVVAALGAP